ncbi:MAG: hypothetical protein ACR2MP_32470 [Streptosporangiaceae bacterium]
MIAGYGPARASAAIAAHDAGARVLVVDSAARGGGNARYSGGFRCDFPGRDVVGHLDALCFGRTPRRVLDTYAAGLHEIGTWLSSLGGATTIFDPPPGRFPAPFPAWPHLPGGADVRYRVAESGTVWGHLTEHGGGLTDAIVFGRCADAAAAARAHCASAEAAARAGQPGAQP